jgi:hypothetical protein
MASILSNMKLRLSLLLGLSLMPGCLSFLQPDVALTPSATEDEAYREALKKATRERTVYKDLETKAIVHAVYLSPEFRNAFADRFNRVFKSGELQFNEAKDKAAFFVSLQVPGLWHHRTDLADPHQWSILLETDHGPVRPVVIKRVPDKEQWRPFFTHITEWSSEFLVIFDAPSINANSEQMVVKTDVKLTIANADAQVNLSW